MKSCSQKLLVALLERLSLVQHLAFPFFFPTSSKKSYKYISNLGSGLNQNWKAWVSVICDMSESHAGVWLKHRFGLGDSRMCISINSESYYSMFHNITILGLHLAVLRDYSQLSAQESAPAVLREHAVSGIDLGPPSCKPYPPALWVLFPPAIFYTLNHVLEV